VGVGVGKVSLKVDDADKGYTCVLRAKGKGVTVLNHKPTKVLRLSKSNPLASRKSDRRSLHQKLVG